MASCGSQTPEWQSQKIQMASDQMAHLWLSGWKARVVVVLFLLSLLVECAPVIKYGTLPRTDQLTTLKIGVSSAADVLRALGEPRGYGMARLPVDHAPRKIWFYEYTQAEGSRVDLEILLVFLHQDHYDGHLWFSSTNLLQREE
jgi:hypothetical protein